MLIIANFIIIIRIYYRTSLLSSHRLWKCGTRRQSALLKIHIIVWIFIVLPLVTTEKRIVVGNRSYLFFYCETFFDRFLNAHLQNLTDFLFLLIYHLLNLHSRSETLQQIDLTFSVKHKKYNHSRESQ
jgi:hypothetical protein